MEGDARVPIEPLARIGVFVSGVVIEDHMDSLADRDARFDQIEEVDEFLVPLSLHVATDYGTVEYVSAANSVVMPFHS